MFDFTVIWEYRMALLQGLWTTFWVSLVAIGCGFIIGALTYLARSSKNRLLRSISTFYVSAFRGTPLLVQLSIVFFFLPLAGITVPSLVAAILTLGMNSGAIQSEILRGGFTALPKGQVEAAWVNGLSRYQSFIYVELPQVIRVTLPALVSEVIDIIKNSSLISTIAVTELMRVAQQYSSTTYRPIEFFLAAGALYLVLTMSVSEIGRLLERRLKH
ncbi:amino acid ABC transporter permease [Vibrio viridaestus]|uniref:Amino acid ABC transporter permease n=1 Tax=Vibrio viridaestus TaxID=2487322 RepID=A0A3N9U2X1_9VIBR|nr:amino acid ABC transporter permease [Vibrio viridaestus]RQW62336.1 amino acid ABC transporter permease [Vibrio viridaestus]